LSNALALRRSVPSGGELSKRDKSSSNCAGGVCGSGASVAAEEAFVVDGEASLSRTVTGLRGSRPVALHPLRMLLCVIALFLARMYISTHATRVIRLELRRAAASVSEASARFNDDFLCTEHELAFNSNSLAFRPLLAGVEKTFLFFNLLS
jgi:hypothetical protein